MSAAQPPVVWSEALEIGIPVIDGQHRRIVDYINRLSAAAPDANRDTVAQVIDELIDYTYSHFAFEEALMEEAGYPAAAIHCRTHEAFRGRLDGLRGEFDAGSDVAGQLAELLRTWLLRHIMSDDTSYAALVRQKMPRLQAAERGNWLGKTLARFFPG